MFLKDKIFALFFQKRRILSGEGIDFFVFGSRLDRRVKHFLAEESEF